MTSAPALPSEIRIYAVGDIHGRFDLLEEMTERIRSDLERSRPARTVEVFLGDYVDRGPQSRDVIEWLVASPPLTDERICLLGNHEDMMLQALGDPAAMSNWLYNGGGETLVSYNASTRAIGANFGLDDLQQAFREAMPKAHLA